MALLHKTLLTCSVPLVLFAANTQPYSVGSQTQYLNTTVHSITATVSRIQRQQKNIYANVDFLHAKNYDVTNINAVYTQDKVTLSAHIPYVRYNRQGIDENSLGDVSAGAAYDFGSFDNDIENKNIFELRYTIDSGDATKNTGMGAQSLSILWETIGQLDTFTLYGSLMWNYYLNDTDNGTALGSDDLYWFGASHKCLLSEKVDTTLKFVWQTKYSDYDANNRQITNTYYNLVDATLQWESDKLVENIRIKAGIRIPIYATSYIDDSVNVFFGVGGVF